MKAEFLAYMHEIQNGIKFEGGAEKRSKENRRGI